MQELEDQFREQAAQADANETAVEDTASSIGEKSGAAADPAKDAREGTDAKNNPSDGGDGSESSDTGETGSDEADFPSGEGGSEADSSKRQLSQKTKAQKEEDRRDKSWKRLQQERADFLREKAEWEAQKLSQFQVQQGNPAVNPDALAKSYDELAAQFEEQGDFDGAEEARRKAKILRSGIAAAQPARPPQAQEASGANNPQFMAAWAANVERAKHDFPEMQDENSEFGKTVTALLRAPDSASYFSGRPDGAYVAAQLTQMKMAALRVPQLEKENAALKEEIKKLRQGMTLPDSGANARDGAARSFDSMTLAEQEAFLRRQAEEEDASARPAVY